MRGSRRAGEHQYPVVLDNSYAIWNAYGQRFWPAWYLIDADGFIRYRHFGEGAYGETEQKVQELLAERDRFEIDPGNLALSWLPQDGIIGDVTT